MIDQNNNSLAEFWKRFHPSEVAIIRPKVTTPTFYLRQVIFRRSAGGVMLMLAGLQAFCQAQTASPPFSSGPRFQRQLQQPVEITWSNTPLREALLGLGGSQRVAVFLDRRIDPQQTINLNLHGSLRQGLVDIAKQRGCDVSLLSSVVYIGPPESTKKLATVLEINRRRVRRLSAESQRRWQRRSSVSWPRLAEPRELVSEWIREADVTLKGVDQIPHDLWPAYQLPPLTILERLVIALAGFDLAVSLDRDGTARILPIPQRVVVSQDYSLSDQKSERLEELKTLCPGAKMKTDGKRLTVVARVEDHDAISNWLEDRRAPRTKQSSGEKRYTLNVQSQPLENVLQSLTAQLDLKLLVANLPHEKRRQRISLQVRNATLDELLQATVKQAGLNYALEGGTLRVSE